ncbi:MAG: ABC transporter ATP-binding protein [Polyangiaceae bacterium]|nr:ABC transporter ATP-binding protein [Polyangiaceae bacterium]
MSDPIVRLRGVTKDYGDAVVSRVLHGIDLRLDPGEFASLIGPSGSGKSTLLNLLGLLDRVTSGSILLRGMETTQLSERELTLLRGGSIGFVFQFHHLISALSVDENVAMPRIIAARRRKPADLRRARELLKEVGLGRRCDDKPSQLSGGQQQRVAIARALMAEPALVLADEPTGNLDTQTADEIFDLLRRFNKERNITFLIVTHDPRLAERTDRTIELVDGRVTSDRTR